MLKEEQECILRWDLKDRRVHIWTNIPAMINKLDRLCEEAGEAYRCVRKKGESAFYECPVKLLTFRKPMSDRERARRSEIARINSAARIAIELPGKTSSSRADEEEEG